jgi:hypothetical protein
MRVPPINTAVNNHGSLHEIILTLLLLNRRARLLSSIGIYLTLFIDNTMPELEMGDGEPSINKKRLALPEAGPALNNA